MSDTPITDAEAYDYETGRRWLDGVVSAHIVRKLERENAALKEQLNHTVSTKYHDEIVQEAVSLRVKETDNLRSELRIAESFHRIAVSERDTLVVENAALRADKQKLMEALYEAEQNMARCLDEGKLPAWSIDCLRAAIDAARKEQP